MFTEGEVLAAATNAGISGASAETSGSNVRLRLSLMEKHGAPSEMLQGQLYKSGKDNMEENI